MIENVRRTSRNVKHWQNGEMALRWTAAGMLEAEQQFRKIIGYRDLAKLALAIERDLTRHHAPTRHHRGGRYARHRLTITPGPPSKFHDDRDILGVMAATGEVFDGKTAAVGARGLDQVLGWARRLGARSGVGAGGLPARVGLV